MEEQSILYMYFRYIILLVTIFEIPAIISGKPISNRVQHSVYVTGDYHWCTGLKIFIECLYYIW